MAGEAFLLSGDQIASYSSVNFTYPPPSYATTMNVTGISPLGSDASRYFLVRTQGSGDPIQNGEFFKIVNAVSDGQGGWVQGTTTIASGLTATPDAYDRVATGDNYNVFGFGGGPKFVVKLDGFNGATSMTVAKGQDATGTGGDGELSLAELTAANPDAVICFAAGTLIDTRTGSVPVETLAVGDEVLTLDHGFQPIRWIGRSRVTLSGTGSALRPVRFRRNCFGPDYPDKDVLVSPAHRLLLEGWRCELLFAEDQVLIPAKFLVNRRTVVREDTIASVDYWHFLLNDHEIVYSSGLRSESFHPASYGVSTLARAARDELLVLFPALSQPDRARVPAPGRYCLKRFEADALLALGPAAAELVPAHPA